MPHQDGDRGRSRQTEEHDEHSIEAKKNRRAMVVQLHQIRRHGYSEPAQRCFGEGTMEADIQLVLCSPHYMPRLCVVPA